MNLLSTSALLEDTPIDHYLARQRELSAVDEFALRHAGDLRPHQEQYYRALLPSTAPGPGEQYGFAVDLDACTGCKACVTACHSMNGLDDGETWRSVSVLRSRTGSAPHQQTVTAACHHCVDPACMRGCPVDAYEKDPVTGIVVHLDDQCIGCTYCTLACPYEVPVFNERRGIVRKCDMCVGRLAAGEAPACVQGCPNGAISITVVSVADLRARAALPAASVVPGAPPSATTTPATVYRSRRAAELASLRSVHVEDDARPSPAHRPLAVTLVLTQVAVGALVADRLLRSTGRWESLGVGRALGSGFAVAVGVLALAASVLHLGRPRYFYRAVIGLRHSWLSREVVAFGGYTGLAAVFAALESPRSPVTVDDRMLSAIGWSACAVGLAGIFCSARIYTLTRRATWSPLRVGALFAGTTVMGGSALVLAVATVASPAVSSGASSGPSSGTSTGWGTARVALVAAITSAAVLKLVAETALLRHRHSLGADPAESVARHPGVRIVLLAGTHLGRAVAVHVGALVTATMLSAWLLVGQPTGRLSAVATVALLGLVTVSELSERGLFFTMVTRPRAGFADAMTVRALAAPPLRVPIVGAR